MQLNRVMRFLTTAPMNAIAPIIPDYLEEDTIASF